MPLPTHQQRLVRLTRLQPLPLDRSLDPLQPEPTRGDKRALRIEDRDPVSLVPGSRLAVPTRHISARWIGVVLILVGEEADLWHLSTTSLHSGVVVCNDELDVHSASMMHCQGVSAITVAGIWHVPDPPKALHIPLMGRYRTLPIPVAKQVKTSCPRGADFPL